MHAYFLAVLYYFTNYNILTSSTIRIAQSSQPCPASSLTTNTVSFYVCLQRIMAVKYAIPSQLRISPECQDLIARIFTANPVQRITLAQIRVHPWFLKNLPAELAVSVSAGGALV